MPAVRRRRRIIQWVSTCLLALVLTAWIDSHFYTQGVWCSRPTWSVAILSKQGRFILYFTGRVSRPGWIWHRLPTDNVRWPLRPDELFDRHGFGFGYAAHKPTSTGPAYALGVPHWLPIVALAIMTCRAARSRIRRAPGCCAICGYDLRATPDRCPECGTAATSSRATCL